MEARDVFPVFGELHADSSQPDIPNVSPRLCVLAFTKRPKQHAPKKRRHSVKQPSRPAPTRETAIALRCGQETRSDTQKAIHAIAFLLEWSSELGNKPVHGVAADGLAALLRTCGSAVGQMFTIVELRAAGGDPKELEVRP